MNVHEEALRIMAAHAPKAFRVEPESVIQQGPLEIVIKRFPVLVDGGCLVLAGQGGTGKTFAGWYAHFRYVLECGGERRPPMFASDIMRLAPGSWSDFDDIKKLNGLLVIDDLGAEYKGEKGWAIAIWSELLNYRYTYRLPTMITTNLPKREIASIYGTRVTSRLSEWGVFYEGRWPDLRVKA